MTHCIVTYGPKGGPRYRIPESAITEWRRAHEQRRSA